MIWVKIQKDHEHQTDELTIYLPNWLAIEVQNTTFLYFGNQKLKVNVRTFHSKKTDNHSYNNPLKINCSQDLLDVLHIPDEVPYKLYVKEGIIHLGPVIGLLLGEQHYYYHHRHMQEYSDAVRNYNQIGGLVIAFKECSIDWDKKCLFGLYYHSESKKWHYQKLPIPSVIYRRGYKSNQQVAEKLSRYTNDKVFNSFRYDKWELHKELSNNVKFKQYLPDTYKLENQHDVLKLLHETSKIILKPSDLSRGRGIYIFKKQTSDSILAVDYNEGNKREFTIPNWAIEDYLSQENLLSKNYILQPYLDLAKIEGNPWDIRVVMQKNIKSGWQCSGIECRVAGKNQFVTNISRGGMALPIKMALEESFGPSVHSNLLKTNVIAAAQHFCEIMDETGEHFAEFGLDLAFDVNQKLWFIEANMRPTFNGFKKMDMANYYYICQNPIRYAAAVDGFY
ncbi:YheC/YheD family protein [Bacillus luteolus]|uniref:YheC/YheD family protein n=1 Tax=Litchfieldia luteola TaxID=682179 RepID=A0ABR9QLR4_9BACI|nr:YheC/YheD family protein [Cytobacillus luteolus]MBE4909424.1 YheC/YheD family protein [Cytobacillus luteolus]MBP1940824.1 glutathione synthase/RimK-type ligase-like ATP-grasp enzyme [Cytobacillus luteolus]